MKRRITAAPLLGTIVLLVLALLTTDAQEAGKVVPAGMVLVPGGTFDMGDSFGEGKLDEKPLHKVEVSNFYMSKYEVTFEEFDAFCTATGNMAPDDAGWGRGKQPVINIDWYETVEYCNWRSLMEGLTPCYTINKDVQDLNNKSGIDALKWLVICDFTANGYRLPTEAEWEYAARAGGKKVRFGNGKDIADPAEMNFDSRAEKKMPYSISGLFRNMTVVVGSFTPNALGLYDMSGNVFEWCWDWYDSEYYMQKPVSNPKGAESGENHVLRGGSWVTGSQILRVSYRGYGCPVFSLKSFGFRLVRSLK